MKKADFLCSEHLCGTCNRYSENLHKCQTYRNFHERNDRVVTTCCGYAAIPNNTLKPCPFCGASVYLERTPINSYRGDFEFEIKCFNCGCHPTYVNNTTIYCSEEEARQNVINTWNRRSYE